MRSSRFFLALLLIFIISCASSTQNAVLDRKKDIVFTKSEAEEEILSESEAEVEFEDDDDEVSDIIGDKAPDTTDGEVPDIFENHIDEYEASTDELRDHPTPVIENDNISTQAPDDHPPTLAAESDSIITEKPDDYPLTPVGEDDNTGTDESSDDLQTSDESAKSTETKEEAPADEAVGEATGKEIRIPPPPREPDVKIRREYPLVNDSVNVSVEEDLTDKKRAQIIFIAVSNATADELKSMAEMYNVDASGDVKAAIFKKFGINVESPASQSTSTESETDKAQNSFKIKSADIIQKKRINASEFVFIDGNVSIEFESGGSSKILKADSILYDISENEILASGNISISSSSMGGQLQNLVAGGLLLNFNSNKIHLEEARGSTRKASSTYYMSGEDIILDTKSSEIYFKSGALLPNDDVDNANWRIASDNIIMKSNGDMFMSGLLLKIGRVPILPLPALFMPGTPLVFNPAIGFASDKGAFVNTTYELYGTYPSLGKAGEGNSIINLLKANGSSSMKKDGILYTPSNDMQNDGNYMALFADVYQSQGFFVGLETVGKFQPSISMKATAGLAYRPLRKPTYFSSSTFKNFRYILDSGFNYSNAPYTVELSLPLLSDPLVKPNYLNRFTAFSFDSIFAGEQEFPSTFSTGSTNEYTWNAKFSYSLPSNLRSQYLNALTLNVTAEHTRYWTQKDGDEYYRFYSGSTSLPNATFSASGTLLSLSAASKIEQAKSVATSDDINLTYSQKLERELLLLRDADSQKAKPQAQEEDDTLAVSSSDAGSDPGAEEEAEPVSDESEESIAQEPENTEKSAIKTGDKKSDEFEKKRYKAKANLSSLGTSESLWTLSGSSLSMRYTINDSFTNTFQTPQNDEILGKRSTTNSLSATLSTSGSLGSRLFTFSNTLRSNYIYSFQENSNNLETKDFSFGSSTQASVPILGIGYDLGAQLYTLKISADENNPPTRAENKFAFDREHISSHSLSFSKNIGVMGFSVSGALPPLSLSFNPTVNMTIKRISTSATHTIKGEDFQSIDNYLTEAKFSYSAPSFNTSLYISHDWQISKSSNSFLEPIKLTQSLSVTLLSSWITITENLSFMGLSSSNVPNYFQPIAFNISTKNSYFSLNFSLSGPYNALELDTTKATARIPSTSFYFWYDRIILKFALTGGANLNFKDAYQNSLTYSIDFDFEIKEFINITFSLNGENNNFTKYTGESRYGRFSPTAMFVDLLRGINFFNIDDMRTSNFKMSQLNLTLTHDMGDWDFRFNFNGNFELDGNEYRFAPKYTITVKWKVIPELKVDKTIKTM